MKKIYGYPTTQEYSFYGIGGQKLTTRTCVPHTYHLGEDEYTEVQCTNGYNVYFGGELVKSKGAVVATDRLGSVRANSNGERMTYYPYGEERTSTADGREKFGTYTRDSVTTDYADQRYYAVGNGRFNTADSDGIGSANPMDPRSWNLYSYVSGDPINFRDVHGRYPCWVGAGEGAELVDCEDVQFPGPQQGRQVDPPKKKLKPNQLTSDQVPGYDEAFYRLRNVDCAQTIGSSIPAYAQAGLAKENFYRVYLGASPTGANDVATASGFKIELNTAIFFDPEHVKEIGVSADGVTFEDHNMVKEFADAFGLDSGKFSAADFQALVLLHELGHILYRGVAGTIEPDANNGQKSLDNTQRVVDKCFKDLKK